MALPPEQEPDSESLQPWHEPQPDVVIAGLSGRELMDEKRRDYRNAVFVQVSIVAIALLVADVGRTPAWYFFLAATGTYLFLLWDMLRNFTARRWLARTLLAVVVGLFAVTVGVNQFGWTFGLDPRQVNLGLFVISLAAQGLVIGHAIADLFDSPRNTVDKLWGSACVYFMSGIFFASLFHILNLLHGDLFGQAVGTGHEAFFEAIYLSFNSLVGLDSAYPNASHLLRNLTVLEGIWGQLYLVLLIGRVLMPADSASPSRLGAD
ncbi:MAG: hypothetical protein HY319_21115 [Armatimonadetes bacterium]|nr:hypothetical protein [Armatimonadota bacterium]